ncbi:unnamed protein product [Caenorhabditis angaria]|uniref:Uncharacterized protein n=1 Tax=Caenorhabditis angaria TaxID=860376 RepID=A0A9P1N4L8_9PELO|nr:unnamed protein product [Caenorhabditis angaria]
MTTPTGSTLGSFYLRETGEIRNIYVKYLFSEMPVHVFNIFIIFFTFYFIFSKKVLIHMNLKIVITSYSLTALFLSIFRLTWLICDVFWVPLNIMEFFMFGRFIFQSSISAHLFVLSTERVIATVNANNYEHKSCSFFIVFWCLMTYPYSGVLLYSKYCIENGRQLNILTTIVCSGGSLIAMLIVYFVNKKQVDARRWKSKVSEAYQIRENIRTSRILMQMFGVGSIFLASACFFVLKFSTALLGDNKYDIIFNGYMYDILVSVGSTIESFLFLYYILPESQRRKVLRRMDLSHYRHRKSITITPTVVKLKFKNIHGIDVEVGANSGNDYFKQLSTAWK